MTEHIPFHDEDALFERLQDELADGKREVVVLAGSALTMPIPQTQEHAAIPGVPLGEGIVERIRAHLGASGDALDEALCNVSNRYQAAFEFLRGRRSADVVNRIVRKAVLEARPATAAPPSEAVLAGDKDACSALEEDTSSWALSPGVEALGRLATGHQRFGKRILTTNFDPLIEVAIGRQPKGQYFCSVLHGDGKLDQTSGRGTHVVHLHGHWHKTDMLHTQAQLLQERPHLSNSLKHLLSKRTFLVMAYSGWDDVFTRALAKVMEDDEAYADVIWTFYDADEARIRRERAEFLASLAPGIGRGRIVFYRGINVHTFLPRLAGAMLGTPRIDPQPLALEKYLSTGRAPLRNVATPATYLVARHQVVPFAGRERDLATLDTWADSGDAVGVLLVHGPGGMGKTRFLTEWLARRAERHPGDAIGFVTGALDDAVIDALCTNPRATVVIDYAEERLGLAALLMRLSNMATAESGAPGRHMRLVLLARNAGDWWASLRSRSGEIAVLLGEPPLELEPLTKAAQDARMAEYRRAHAAFVAALQRRPANANPAIASTAIVTHLGADPDLGADHFERPLYVHMTALSAALGNPQTGAPRDILDEILDHEQRYWARYLGMDPADFGWRQRTAELQEAAAAVVVRGSCAREDLPFVMEALTLPDAGRICALFQDLYPDPARARAWVVAVEPDLVAEALLCSVLERRARPESWLVSALTGIEPLHWEHAFTVLGPWAWAMTRR